MYYNNCNTVHPYGAGGSVLDSWTTSPDSDSGSTIL